MNKEFYRSMAKNLLFFDSNLSDLSTPEVASKGRGLLHYIESSNRYAHEAIFIGKMKLIKRIIESSGDVAIDRYTETTERPDKSSKLYQGVEAIKSIDPEIGQFFESMLAPIPKHEFPVLLEIYNEFFNQGIETK